jgi:hypothetical protein
MHTLIASKGKILVSHDMEASFHKGDRVFISTASAVHGATLAGDDLTHALEIDGTGWVVESVRINLTQGYAGQFSAARTVEVRQA